MNVLDFSVDVKDFAIQSIVRYPSVQIWHDIRDLVQM